MRISNNQIYDSFLRYDKIHQKDIARYTDQISSGKRILTPSDDPTALARSLKTRETRNEIDNYINNINDVQTREVSAQTALTNIYETAQDARVEIIRLLNHGVLDQEDAQIVNDYLQGLKEYMIDQANTKVGDVYLFSGTKSDTAPFDSAGNYQGNQETQKVAISKGYEVDATYDGSRLNMKDLIGALDAIDAAIQAGDLTSITQDTLNQFDRGMDAISKERSFIGNQAKNVEEFKLQHETFKTVYNNIVSNLEDADITQAIANLEQAKVAYEASMTVFTQNRDLSLLKFL